MKNTGRLILVGGGDFSREIICQVEDLFDIGKSIKIDGFLDDNPDALSGYDYSLSYLGSIQAFSPRDDDLLVMGVGDPQTKKRLFLELKAKGAKFSRLIHPTAVVARTAKIGEGVIVFPHVFISADAVVGDICAINGFSSVGHDVSLGSFSTLSAHVDLTGHVKVGECAFFGSGARVLPKVRVGSGARIGAGATIMRSVPEGAVMYAPPSKRL